MGEPSLDLPLPARAPGEHLDSWKEIAAYLNRDVTTVQRWEKREGMPVHRHVHDKRGSVYAIASELDQWQESRRKAPEPDPALDPPSAEVPATTSERPAKRPTWIWLGATAITAVLLVAGILILRRSRHQPEQPAHIRSIAVLPLHNLSGDPSQDYLAEGMTEALIDRLSSIRDLRVVSHTSVMRFKNPQVSVPEIARTLGVDALVEGSVNREGSRIRVTAQLIRGATDDHFWSQTYDRDMKDVLALESDVAQSIVGRIQVTLTGREQQTLAAARPVAPEVYESYMKGRFSLDKNQRADFEDAIRNFQDALRRDPEFSPAYLGLAQAYNELTTVYAGAPPQEPRRKAMEAVRRALELDPNVPAGHDLLAGMLLDDWQWAEAEAEYRRAFELNPNDAAAYSGFAEWLLCQGRTDEALTAMNRARELDPMSVSGIDLAWILFASRRYDQAIHELHSSLSLRPEDANALWFLGFVLIANNQAREAVPVLEKAAALSGQSPGVLGVLVRAYAHAGRRKDAMRVLASLQQRQRSGYVPAGAFVNAYLGLDDNEHAFTWLEKAYGEKSHILKYVKTEPFFDPIRSDPRFKDLVHRVGLG